MEKHKFDVLFLCTYLIGIVIGLIFMVGRWVGIAKVRGLDRFPHGRQRLLLVSNHPHKGEQFLLIALFFPGYLLKPFSYGPFTMADMKNYFDKFPWKLCRSKLVSVNRTGRLTGAGSLEVAKNILEHDGNLIMFPQGTRTNKVPEELLLRSPKKGKPMGPFKTGFARLATEVPHTTIVPVWSEINSWWDIKFIIGEPMIFTTGTPREEVVERTEKILLELADQAN